MNILVLGHTDTFIIGVHPVIVSVIAVVCSSG